MATTESVLHAPVPGLKPGYMIRYVVTTQDRAKTDELDFEKFVVLSVSNSGSRSCFVTGDIESVRGFDEHAKFLVGRSDDAAWWILPSPPRYHLESLQPAPEKFLPTICLSGGQSTWQEIGTEYLGDLSKRLRPDDAAIALAKKLTESTSTDASKIAVILDWIQKQLTYQAIEFGTRASIPSKAGRIIQNRYGDCKDHSLLAHQMLTAAGVPSHLALVHSTAPIRKEFPSLNQFDHMIVYLPKHHGGVSVDCTSKNLVPDITASAWLADKEALVLDADSIRFETISRNKAADSRVVCDKLVTLDKDHQSCHVEEKLTLEGVLAGRFRAWLRETNAVDVQRNLQNLLGTYARMRLLSVDVSGLNTLDQPLCLRMKYQLPRVFHRSGAGLVGSLPAVWEHYFFEQPFASERKTPFELKTPISLQSTTRFEVPSGITVDTDSLVDQKQETAWLAFDVRSEKQANAVTLTSKLSRNRGLFPSSDYRPFLDAIDTAMDTAQGRLMLKSNE